MINYFPTEFILIIGIATVIFSLVFEGKIKEKIHPALPYFLGVILTVTSIGLYVFELDTNSCTYKFSGKLPIEYSKGGSINYFFQFDGELYDAYHEVPDFNVSSKSVFVYETEENPNLIRSFFNLNKNIQFRSAEDAYILRVNRVSEKAE